jgi:hypothetical protein
LEHKEGFDMKNLSLSEKEELAAIMAEMELSPFERRKRRFDAAHVRLWGGEMKMTGLADMVMRARTGQPLTLDEFIVSHPGLLPNECKRGRTPVL